MPRVLILGASSDMARATAHRFAREGYDLYLCGRNTNDLKVDASDISSRYNVKAEALKFDALDYKSHDKFYEILADKPETALLFFGYLGDHEKAKTDFAETEKIIHSNYTGAVSILNRIASDFEKRGSGTILGVSSVAGDRGRQSNYFYGSAKAGLTAYLSGLRQSLSKKGVHVITVKPGFVATKMTEGMELPGALLAEPEVAANDIYSACRKRKNVIYTKGIWRLVMLIIRHIPESVFKKTNI